MRKCEALELHLQQRLVQSSPGFQTEQPKLQHCIEAPALPFALMGQQHLCAQFWEYMEQLLVFCQT